MSNPFLDFQQYESKPPRNSFDVSRRCYMTGKLGGLYPCLLIEVNSGDSIQIDSSMLFNFFPFIFPVQTPLRASVYYFYGRNRNEWENWKDFSYNNKQPDHPFILQPSGAFWKTGSLADYLGVPTTYSSLGDLQRFSLASVPHALPLPSGVEPRSSIHFFCNSIEPASYNFSDLRGIVLSDLKFQVPSSSVSSYWMLEYDFWLTKDLENVNLTFSPSADWDSSLITSQYSTSARYFLFAENGYLVAYSTVLNNPSLSFQKLDYGTKFSTNVGTLTLSQIFDELGVNARYRLVLALTPDHVSTFFSDSYIEPLTVLEPSNFNFYIEYNLGTASTVDLSELGSNPFSGTLQNPPAIPLNAIPFRLYEAIYNCYFRNERNDPFMIDGEPEYNKYNTTLADGADTTPYHIYFRNWEADFLTTATQTPQQGIAPLVGINVRGDMEFMNEDGTITRIRPTIDDDGHTITGIAGVVENGTPEALRSAMDYITAGISINDFRQVNSLQRWLEDNLRRGLKYRDQVMASTGVKIRYDELDLPEFIGGYSRPVQMTAITQATPATADDNALGDRAGQASVFGGSKHKIQHYCDEAGFIMGIVCITPQPVYTQLLPKYFLKSDALSYYHPQFGTIGMQPISYREVCPVQVFQESGNLNDVFGYQRPWYDLIGSYDEAHGLMRTNMRDFLMHRTFAGIPKLGAEFLHVDPEQLNDVFAYTDGSQDVFQGQIYSEVYVKRAIPRFGIPRIN